MGYALMSVVTFVIMLAGYDAYEHRNDPTPPPPVPDLVSTAPDGTKLYHLYTGGHDVYFSKSGTTHEACHMVGKITHCETVTTPNAE